MNRKIEISALNFGLAFVLIALCIYMLATGANRVAALALLPIAFANIVIGIASRAALTRQKDDAASNDGNDRG